MFFTHHPQDIVFFSTDLKFHLFYPNYYHVSFTVFWQTCNVLWLEKNPVCEMFFSYICMHWMEDYMHKIFYKCHKLYCQETLCCNCDKPEICTCKMRMKEMLCFVYWHDIWWKLKLKPYCIFILCFRVVSFCISWLCPCISE